MINKNDVPQFSKTIQWLLQSQTPSIRYLTMTRVLGMARTDPEVSSVRQRIPISPPVEGILAAQQPEGYWERAKNIYSPKYRSSHWSMLLLMELGVEAEDPHLQQGAQFILEALEKHPPYYLDRKEIGLGCFWGNWLRSHLYCGRKVDPFVEEVIDFVCEDVQRGGRCRYNKDLPCAWGVARGLYGLALITETQRSTLVCDAINKGIRFFLEEYDLLKANFPPRNRKHPLWNKLSFPLYYQADKLFVLRILKELRALDHPRAQEALTWLLSKQTNAGIWRGGSPFKSSWPFLAGADGVERWITLQVLEVLT